MSRLSFFREKEELQRQCALQAPSLYLLVLCYWWVGRFNTLNAIPKETELTPHFRSTDSSGWKKIPRPIPLASKVQLAASGHRTVPGKKHNCLLCLSLLSPPGHTGADHLPAIISRQELTCFRFITHGVLHCRALQTDLGTAPKHQERKVRSGQESIIHAGSTSKQTPKAAALGEDRPQIQILEWLHPV